MKNIILEEINRAKLLMNYDNNNTLSENVKKVTLNETMIISEQGRKAFLKAILGTADDAALATIRNARSAEYIAARNLFNDVKILQGKNLTDYKYFTFKSVREGYLINITKMM